MDDTNSEIDARFEAANCEQIQFTSLFGAKNKFRELWSTDFDEVARGIDLLDLETAAPVRAPRQFHVPPNPKRPPPWFLGLSKEFQRDISHINGRLQSKILGAISDLVSQPTSPRGNTVKPLRASLRGYWRYRIEDFRLVYYPDKDTGNIILLAFTSRGSTYDD